MSKPEKTTVCSPKVLLDAAQEKDIRDLANIVSMVKSRTRRPRRKQKKQDSDRIPRPMNCFMAYRLEKQKEIVARCPGANHRDISKVVAKWWRRESENVKQKYRNIAEKAKQQHSITYPNYKYTPKRKKRSTKNKKKEQPSPSLEYSTMPATSSQDSSSMDMARNMEQTYYLSHPLDPAHAMPSWLSPIPYANPSYLMQEGSQTPPEALLLSPYTYGNFHEEDAYYAADQQLAPPLEDIAAYRQSAFLGYPPRPSISFSISTTSSIESTFALGHETYLGSSSHEQVFDLYHHPKDFRYERVPGWQTTSSTQEPFLQDSSCCCEPLESTVSSFDYSSHSL